MKEQPSLTGDVPSKALTELQETLNQCTEKDDFIGKCSLIVKDLVKDPQDFCGAFWNDKEQWYHGPQKVQFRDDVAIEPSVPFHPSLELAQLKEAEEKKRLKELLADASAPLDLAEVNDKVKRIIETQKQTKQKLLEILDDLSLIDEKELELLELMIKRYKRMEG